MFGPVSGALLRPVEELRRAIQKAALDGRKKTDGKIPSQWGTEYQTFSWSLEHNVGYKHRIELYEKTKQTMCGIYLHLKCGPPNNWLCFKFLNFQRNPI